MKSAHDLIKCLPAKFHQLLLSDQQDIDNPDRYHHARLNYWDRTRKKLDIFESVFPDCDGVSVLDVGCAQGNLSLLLAERGYHVTALDINPVFLEYARLKHEHGDIQWVIGNFSRLPMVYQYNAVVLGQLLEHCAYPEELLTKAASLLKPGGMLLITTPNARMFRNNLPTFSQIQQQADRRHLAKRQYGPDGKDHLFLFTLQDLKRIIPHDLMLQEAGYLGGTVLINRHSTFLLRCFPASWVEKLERAIACTPVLNQYVCHDLYMVLKKVP